MSADSINVAAQYLTFKLKEEVFAIEISKVREVLEYTALTKVPRTPDFMSGVINLRGNVVPVIDLNLKLGMPQTERTINTCIIIVEIAVSGETVVLGALTDSVQEVIEIEPENIEPVPKIGTNLNIEFLQGMGKKDDHFMMIFDIDKVFSTEDITAVSGDFDIKKQEDQPDAP
jgi:purine-binding chemotaxis protein CheW